MISFEWRLMEAGGEAAGTEVWWRGDGAHTV